MKRIFFWFCIFSLLGNFNLLADLSDGLVAYYPFNGNANDVSGNANNGVVYGATLTTNRFGYANAAYDFNGSSSYIDIPQSANLNLTANFTLSVWIYQRSVQPLNGYRILDKCLAGQADGWTFDTYDGGTGRRLRFQAVVPNSDNVPGATVYSLMQWHHVVATVSGTVGKVYLDGKLDGTGDVGNIPENALDMFIGRAHPDNGAGVIEWFDGIIDDVRIYNRTLSDAEVLQLFNDESNNPLPGAISAISNGFPTQLVYGNYPTKQPGKDSLIVITHGWGNKLLSPFSPSDPTWVDSMSNAITGYLTNHGITNWQVYGYKWVNNSWTITAMDALNNAKGEGVNLGSAVGIQRWSHVHLIGHSAGAEVIQEASQWIKAISPSTTVQCTFLDAFVGNDYAGVNNYGNGANWSDSYFSKDITGDTTQQPLVHAYNVDVTQLGPKQDIGKFRSQTSGQIEVCSRTIEYHEWPIDFYSNTIVGNVTSNYLGFGFPLSMEGGNWAYATNQYAPGNLPAQILGTPDPTCMSDLQLTPIVFTNYTPDFTSLPTIQSVTGTIQTWVGSLGLTPDSPAWLATVVSITNPVNSISFDAEFSGISGSEDMLGVYWDTNIIGSVDERVVQPGFQHYLLTFANATAYSLHVLGFRLDPFTSAKSSIILTNIAISQVGVSQQPSLTLTTNMVNGLRVFQLTGESGFAYGVQSSTNLFDWTDIIELMNTNGTVQFYDQDEGNYPMRFYRVVVPSAPSD